MSTREESKMDVGEAILRRKSVRKYDQKPVPEEALARVLEAGRLAPSAMNYQPWHFIVVRDKATREKLSGGKYARFLAETPVVIVGCGDKKKSARWYVVDTTIALQQMVLAATAEGLGTCWIGSFEEDVIREALGIDERHAVVAMLALGYPLNEADLQPRRPETFNRRKLSEIVSYDTYET
jgi:nitroreductase